MFTLKLLGGASLEGPKGPLTGAASQRQRLALLALVALSPNSRISRNKALSYLWPESDEERARHGLSNALYSIKKQLGDEAVSATGDDLCLNTGIVGVDVLAFEEAHDDDSYETAVLLFRGPFMDGAHLHDSPEFEQWVDGHRDRLGRLYAHALEKLAQQASAIGEDKAAVEWWRRLAACDPYNSAVAMELMRSLDAAGNRTAAIQHARLYTVLVTEELGAEPDLEVQDLAEQLRTSKAPLRAAADSVSRVQPTLPTPDDTTSESRHRETSDKETRGLTSDARTKTFARLRRGLQVAASAIIAAFVTILVVSQGKDPTATEQGSTAPSGLVRDRPSVAVLPFDNISPDPSDAYLADGMHEEVLTRLSKIAGLIVISRSSVMMYREQELAAPEIARELGVSALLEGSVQKAGGQIRITAQLIDGATDAHIWGESYDHEFTVENLFATQTAIALQIAESLRTALTVQERGRIERPATRSLTAYELYLKGQQAYSRYRANENESAIRLFKEAVSLDPEFGMAWAGLANAYGQAVLLFGLPSNWLDSAVAASQRSIALDPDRAEGHKALGLAFTARGAYRPALDAYSRALETDPNHATATANVGVMHQRFGALEDALLWTQRALARAPNHPLIRANIAWSYLSLGEWDLAEEWAHEAIALDSTLAHALQALAVAAFARGDQETATELALRIVENDPTSPVRQQFAAEMALFSQDFDAALRYSEAAHGMTLGGSIPPWHFPGTTLAFLLHQTGEINRATEHLDLATQEIRNLLEEGSDDPRLSWELGCAHAIQGRTEEALEWLERGFEAGWRWLKIVEVDPLLDSVRGTARFRAILDEMTEDVERMRRQAAQTDQSTGLR